MKIQPDEIVNNSDNYTGAIQPIGIMIDETFTLTKLRKNFSAEEMNEDLILVPVPKYIALGSIIDLNCPVGQFILIAGIFIFLLKTKKRNT